MTAGLGGYPGKTKGLKQSLAAGELIREHANIYYGMINVQLSGYLLSIAIGFFNSI
jgi:hypothetical protein